MIELRNYSGLRVGGTAFGVLEMRNSDEVLKALNIVKEEKLIPYIIGEGTNTCWGDGSHDKLVLLSYVGASMNAWIDGDGVIIEVEAGMKWDDLVTRAAEYGFGLEALAGIPGTVGAAPVQNIGAYGSEFADCCVAISGFDIETGEKMLWRKEDCNFGYRSSIFNTTHLGKYLITRVQLRLTRGLCSPLPKEAAGLSTPLEVAMRIKEVRSLKLPDYKKEFNCGSYFKNPIVDEGVAEVIVQKYPLAPHWSQEGGIKLSAGWLIEQCGFKGKELTPHVKVSEKHALVITTDGNASCNELLSAEGMVVDAVREKFNVTLCREPNLVK